jgi:hypothetical protein
MTNIPEKDWIWFDNKRDSHECDERCFGGKFPNPIADVNNKCECLHDRAAHWKGKKCRAYACCCMKFVASED